MMPKLKFDFSRGFREAFSFEQLKYIEDHFDLSGKVEPIIEVAIGHFSNGYIFEICTDVTLDGSIEISVLDSEEDLFWAPENSKISAEKMFELIDGSKAVGFHCIEVNE
jgi:hypothetical protein